MTVNLGYPAVVEVANTRKAGGLLKNALEV